MNMTFKDRKKLLVGLDWAIRGLLAMSVVLFIYETNGYLDMKMDPEVGAPRATAVAIANVIISILIGAFNWYFVVRKNSTIAASILFIAYSALIIIYFNEIEADDIEKYKLIDYGSDAIGFIILGFLAYSWSICYGIRSELLVDKATNQSSVTSSDYSEQTSDPKKKLESSLDNLEKLYSLKIRGIITDEEYESEKKKNLNL